jgi:hypothetical protein
MKEKYNHYQKLGLDFRRNRRNLIMNFLAIKMQIKVKNYLLISGIQHFIFCRRQWALIHIEQLWEENFFTIDGQIKHGKVDSGNICESKNDIRIIQVNACLYPISYKYRANVM